MKPIRNILFAFLFLMPFVGCQTGSSTSESDLASEVNGGEQQECAFTQGYWKNHPDAWPCDKLKLGNVEYTKAELLAIFRQPVAGNGLISLAHQLIAAKLNVANNADGSDIADEIVAADALIGGLKVPPSGTGWLSPSATSSLTGKLDTFNNTGECERQPICGNGVKEDGETCDDHNLVGGDGCSSTCQKELCGNGVLDVGEECDDHNLVAGDGCSSTCKCEPVCGNGVMETGETCDDHNLLGGDGCSSTCQRELCGNGVVDVGEECDDHNLVGGDGCSSTCQHECACP